LLAIFLFYYVLFEIIVKYHNHLNTYINNYRDGLGV
jgi:hypothetical protein